MGLKFAKLMQPIKLPADYTKLSQAERADVRREYIRLQHGRCQFCLEPLRDEPSEKPRINWNRFPKGFLNHPIHLHHDHKTGMTVGAVHAYCNAILWQYHGE